MMRCVVYNGNSWAILTSQHAEYQCYARTMPPLPPTPPPPPSPPPLPPPLQPPPPPRTVALEGVGPWPVLLFGELGMTSAASTEPDGVGGVLTHSRGTSIFGPFLPEISESRGHSALLRGLGCAAGTGSVPAGVDTRTAEQVLATQCNVTLPRTDPAGNRIGLLSECGGIGANFHFHERLTCVEDGRDAALGHSLQVGQAIDGRAIYGAFEIPGNTSSSRPPLDACGGHFGPEPGNPSGSSYHYHVSEAPPFTLACFGPAGAYANGTLAVPDSPARLVSMSECRAIYPSECGDAPATALATSAGDLLYDLWCPCFDDLGSNVGSARAGGGGGGGSGGRSPESTRSRTSNVNVVAIVSGSVGFSCLFCQIWCVFSIRHRARKEREAGVAPRARSAARVAPNRPSPSTKWEAGHSVLIKELVARPDLNGLIGSVVDYNEERGRYNVTVSGETIALKPANLTDDFVEED